MFHILGQTAGLVNRLVACDIMRRGRERWKPDMQPASNVIQKFDGVRPLARALSSYLRKPVSPSQVSRWQLPKPDGAGGMIPAKFHGPLLAIAKRKCVKLTADDLVYR